MVPAAAGCMELRGGLSPTSNHQAGGMRKRIPGAIRHHLYSCVDIPVTHNILFAINLAQYPVPLFLTLARASPDPRYRFIRSIHRLRPAQTGTFFLYVSCVVASTGRPLHPNSPPTHPTPTPPSYAATRFKPHPITHPTTRRSPLPNT